MEKPGRAASSRCRSPFSICSSGPFAFQLPVRTDRAAAPREGMHLCKLVASPIPFAVPPGETRHEDLLSKEHRLSGSGRLEKRAQVCCWKPSPRAAILNSSHQPLVAAPRLPRLLDEGAFGTQSCMESLSHVCLLLPASFPHQRYPIFFFFSISF